MLASAGQPVDPCQGDRSSMERVVRRVASTGEGTAIFLDELRNIVSQASPDEVVHIVDAGVEYPADALPEHTVVFGEVTVEICFPPRNAAESRRLLGRLRSRRRESRAAQVYHSICLRVLDLATVLPLWPADVRDPIGAVVTAAATVGLRVRARICPARADGSVSPGGPLDSPDTELIPAVAKRRDGRLPNHILVLSWRCPKHPLAGGAEVMLSEHMRRWVRQGHAVTLICPRFPGGKRREKVEGVDVVRAGGRFTVYAWAALIYLLRFRNSVDTIVDVENGIPFFTPLYARKPIVCLLHHVHQRQFLMEFGPLLGRIGRILEGQVMPRVYRRTQFVVVSDSSRKELAELGVPISNIRVVHNGVDHDAYECPVPVSARPRLLYLGRLKRHKRIDLLIEMCARLCRSIPDLALDIVGSGDDEPRLRELVRELGLHDAVTFHGFVDHETKVQLFTRAWALVCTSEREGWGLTTVEAAACGTPTLCLDVPGLRDAVRPGVSGWVARDLEELYGSALRLLTDADWRSRLQHGARSHAQHFTWGASAQAGRDAVIDTHVAHRGDVARRPLETMQVITMIHRRDNVPAWAWPFISEAVACDLRTSDTVTPLGDGISVDVMVGSDANVAPVSRRIAQTLDRLSPRIWQEVGRPASTSPGYVRDAFAGANN